MNAMTEAMGSGRFAHAPQQATPGQRVALTGEGYERWLYARGGVLYKLSTSRTCRSFLASHGIDPGSAIGAVNMQRAYDGTRSTITRAEAGLVDPDNPVEVRLGDLPVSTGFRRGRGTNATTAIYPNGRLGTSVASRSDVYYRPNSITGATILHEALHSLLGATDTEIQQRLALDTTQVSGNISQTLRDNDCE
jgi:hypothetical protein